MMQKRVSRRDFLRTATGAGLAFIAAGINVPGLLAQDATATPTPAPTATPLPLPEGAAGKLTVIHKTEYFVEVQDLFREAVVEFAGEKNVELDISTANPELFGDFLAKMEAAVRAGNPPDIGYHTLSIPQMYALDIVEDVTDIVEEAISLYGPVVPVIAEFNAKIDGKWWAVPLHEYHRGLVCSQRFVRGQGHRCEYPGHLGQAPRCCPRRLRS
jgi:multiple sugar transport system substrate-binding protein